MYQALAQASSLTAKAARRADAASQEFAQFFPHLSLWFNEANASVAVEQQGVRFVLRGVLDEAKTDVPAIDQLMRAALALPPRCPVRQRQRRISATRPLTWWSRPPAR